MRKRRYHYFIGYEYLKNGNEHQRCHITLVAYSLHEATQSIEQKGYAITNIYREKITRGV